MCRTAHFPGYAQKRGNFPNAVHKRVDLGRSPHAKRLELAMQSRALHSDEFSGAGDIA
jgi:hypothetical protein